jgi:ribosomal protein S12 methylthiotransferase
MELLLDARLQRQAPEIDGRLLINDGTAAPGSLVEVEITDAHAYDVVGRLVRVLAPGKTAAVRLPVMG